MIACPHCHATYDNDELRYCGKCGSDMQELAAAVGRRSGRRRAVSGEQHHSPDGSDPMVGRTIDGRYRVIEQIGMGGMGAVYKVEHTAMGKIAALKILHPTLSGDREVVKRFRREAEAVAKLTSQHTVQVFDFGEAQGQLYMVMELIRGEDLGKIIRRDGVMPWPRAAALLLQICDALSEAHEAGIVHRDLKPENVMVARGPSGSGAREFAKVLDFGLAKLRQSDELGAVTARGSLIGTPFYMSPEQIRCEEPDARSDLYSLGAMMYRMLTGEHPFSGTTPIAVVTAHLTQTLVPPSQRAPHASWDPRVEAIIVRCLAKERGDRYGSADEVRREIDRVLREARGPDTSPAPRDPTPTVTGERGTTEMAGISPAARLSREDFDRYERSLRIRRWIGVSLLPVVLIGGGGLAWWVWAHDPRPNALELEREPNDTPQSANPIAPGDRPWTVRGTIGARIQLDESDRDLFRFHVARGAVLRAELSAIQGMDVILELYGGHGEREAQVDNGGVGDGEVLPNQRVDPGDHYLAVREVWVAGRRATEDVTDEYRLSSSLRPLVAVEEAEPDDTPQQAVALPLGLPIAGYLSRANDTDFYYLEGFGGGALRGQLSGIEGVDVRLIVLPPGTRVDGDPAHSTGARIFDAGGAGHGEHFTDVAWPSGGAAPMVVVERRDRVPGPGAARATVTGVDQKYALTVERAGASSPGPPKPAPR